MTDVTTRPGLVRMNWGVKIPLRDGTQLSATVYLPDGSQSRAPAVFILTPYVAQSFHERGVYFAERGFPFLAVDARGRGNSDGEFRCFHDAPEDAYDVVEWLAEQSYCNGKVAMWGGSYQGYVQWAAVKSRPPHLATIVPVASPWLGLDTPMRSNIFTPYMLQWLYMISGHTLQDKLFSDQPFWSQQFRRWFESGVSYGEIDAFLGHGTPPLAEWLQHPRLDSYWDSFNPTPEQYAQLRIPVLTITGIYDGDQPGALEHYRQHLKNDPDACHYLVIGPWDHAGTRTPRQEFCGLKMGPASLVDLPRLHEEWYAWTMQNGPRPGFLQDTVSYYVAGADKWRYANTLEAITSHVQPLHLQSVQNPDDLFRSGSLVPELPTTRSEPDHYIYDPRDISLAAIECSIDPHVRTDQRMLHASTGRQLVYHSAPFDVDTEISGFFKLSVWLAIDQLDTDFTVAVYEVALDGSVTQLTNDQMRARYREGLRVEKLITTAAPLRYDFDRFMFTSHKLKAGSRLRLVIGPINSIFSQKNYNSGGEVARESMRDARVVTVRLFHDESRPSALYVPFGQPD